MLPPNNDARKNPSKRGLGFIDHSQKYVKPRNGDPVPPKASGGRPRLDNTPAWMAAASSAQAAARAEAAPAAPAAAPADPLPPDWVELPIFYNTVTGATSWERPRLVVMAGDRQIP